MKRLITALLAIALAGALPAAGQDMREIKDIVYATVDGKDLGLDLYLPAGAENPPLLVWIHGGAWRFGDKSGGVPLQFVDAGFALASLDFRQSTEAPFPAMAHDIKGAIRFLRANAGEYGYAQDRVGIAGASSGAHLAAVVGLSNGHEELEGEVGGNAGASSDVQAVISYFGAHDLTTILSQSTPFGLSVREPALELLLGAHPDEAAQLAQLASPVYHVDAGDPPLLLFHGDRDPQMPINQSLQLQGAYEGQGLDVTYVTVHGASHGGEEFYSPEHLETAIAFLRRTLGD